MPKYKVTVERTLTREVPITAYSRKEAIEATLRGMEGWSVVSAEDATNWVDCPTCPNRPGYATIAGYLTVCPNCIGTGKVDGDL